MMFARAWHMYSSFPTAVLCTARGSSSSSRRDPVVGIRRRYRFPVVQFQVSLVHIGFASTDYSRGDRAVGANDQRFAT